MKRIKHMHYKTEMKTNLLLDLHFLLTAVDIGDYCLRFI